MSNLIIDAGKIGLQGFFKIEACQKDEEGNIIPGTERVLADWFPNLITNVGLDMLVAAGSGSSGGAGFARACRVGSGSATPAVTDTTLQAQVAGVTRNAQPGAGGAPNSNVAPYFSGVTFTWRFGQGAAAGNLSEIGVGPAVTGNLFSRALIKDGSGNPTTITVLPIEFLTVTYQLRIYYDPTPLTTNFTLNSVDYEAVTTLGAQQSANAAWVSDHFGAVRGDGSNDGCKTFNGAFNGVFAIPSGESGSLSNSPTSTIGGQGTGAPYQDVTYQFTINQGNAAAPGVTAMMPNTSNGRCWFYPKTSFNPPLSKDNTKTMSITWRATFGRYTP